MSDEGAEEQWYVHFSTGRTEGPVSTRRMISLTMPGLDDPMIDMADYPLAVSMELLGQKYQPVDVLTLLVVFIEGIEEGRRQENEKWCKAGGGTS